jgi:hypothetical protein
LGYLIILPCVALFIVGVVQHSDSSHWQVRPQNWRKVDWLKLIHTVWSRNMSSMLLNGLRDLL